MVSQSLPSPPVSWGMACAVSTFSAVKNEGMPGHKEDLLGLSDKLIPWGHLQKMSKSSS